MAILPPAAPATPVSPARPIRANGAAIFRWTLRLSIGLIIAPALAPAAQLAPQATPTPAVAAPLGYEVFISDGVERSGGTTLPNGAAIVSSPISTTLIFGKTDAVLVDPPMTLAQTRRVIEWVRRSGKHLAYIYSTHGHGDHWFGTKQLLDHFPDAIAYATDGTLKLMRQQATQGRTAVYDKYFPRQIGATPVLARRVPDAGITLEGRQLLPIQVGHSDTDDSTVLFVPSTGLVVAGDVAYNGVHQYLLEGGAGGLQAWLAAIAQVSALHPRAVVAGHKQPGRLDDPIILEQTRQYLLDAQRLIAQGGGTQAFFDQMVSLHPDRMNQGPLWYSAIGLLGPVAAATSPAAPGHPEAHAAPDAAAQK